MSRPTDRIGTSHGASGPPAGFFPVDLRPSVFWKPESLKSPAAWAGHIPFAFWLIDVLRPSRYVELGTHTGNSYFAMCQAVKQLDAGTECFAVDTWQGDEHAGEYGEEVFSQVSLHNVRYKSFSKLIRSTFDDAIEEFADGSVDLLHIDGLHTYDGVRHDFESWLPKLTSNAIVLFHDTAVLDRGFGVFQLWREIEKKYPAFEFVHSNGLGVISLAKNPPQALRAFFASAQNKDAYAGAREIFSNLGQILTAQLILEQDKIVRAEEHSRLSKLTHHYEVAISRAQGLEAEAKAAFRQAETVHAQLVSVRAEYAAQSAILEKTSADLAKASDNLARASGDLAKASADLERARADTRREEKKNSELARTLEEANAAALINLNELDTLRAQLGSLKWSARHAASMLKSRVKSALGIARPSTSSNEPLLDQNATHDANRIVRQSGLFDSAFYLTQFGNSEVPSADLIEHYLQSGAKQGKDPNQYFNTSWFLSRHRDIASSGWNPLVHYVLFGWKEGRATSADFDPAAYLASNPDVLEAGVEPLWHYLHHGSIEGRRATASMTAEGSSFFDIVQTSDIGFVTTAQTSNRARTLNLTLLLPAEPVATAELPTKVDVIVPVYGGLEETRRCLESVLEHRASNACFGSLIIIDDCGPDVRMRPMLEEIVARETSARLLVNSGNMGFVKSVNRGMRESARDVVLLNADAEVYGNWLDRMAHHAAVDRNVATVTAFSNNATICTFPAIGGAPDLPLGKTLAEIDDAFSTANAGRSAELPTGVGFCMLISRRSLDQLGLFDEAFGRGYGEETDFCQKAVRGGWRNLLAGDVFVFHHGSVSFGASSAKEQLTAGAVMRERYPDYEPSVARWIASDPARSLRFTALAKIIAEDVRPVILHVLHPWGGGTEKQVADIATRYAADAQHLVLITQKTEDGISLSLLVQDGKTWRRLEVQIANLQDFSPVLKSFGVARVHVHHALEVMESLPSLIDDLRVPYDLSVHDYALVCPRNNLILKGKYCGEPDEHGCLNCLRQEPRARGLDIILWRHKGVDLLERASRVICPTVDVAARIKGYAPRANVIAVPHEDALYHPQRSYVAPRLAPHEELRVASLGVLAPHKGGAFLLDCIEQAKERKLTIKWKVMGRFSDDLAERAHALEDVLHVTGSYDPKDVASIIRSLDPHLIFFPQHCVETYSYTLSEAMESGRAILAPKLGAFPERISGVEGCWAYEIEESPSRVLDKLVSLRAEIFGASILNKRELLVGFRQPENPDIPVDRSFYERSYREPLVKERV